MSFPWPTHQPGMSRAILVILFLPDDLAVFFSPLGILNPDPCGVIKIGEGNIDRSVGSCFGKSYGYYYYCFLITALSMPHRRIGPGDQWLFCSSFTLPDATFFFFFFFFPDLKQRFQRRNFPFLILVLPGVSQPQLSFLLLAFFFLHFI